MSTGLYILTEAIGDETQGNNEMQVETIKHR